METAEVQTPTPNTERPVSCINTYDIDISPPVSSSDPSDLDQALTPFEQTLYL
jgi:hypothetical protein